MILRKFNVFFFLTSIEMLSESGGRAVSRGLLCFLLWVMFEINKRAKNPTLLPHCSLLQVCVLCEWPRVECRVHAHSEHCFRTVAVAVAVAEAEAVISRSVQCANRHQTVHNTILYITVYEHFWLAHWCCAPCGVAAEVPNSCVRLAIEPRTSLASVTATSTYSNTPSSSINSTSGGRFRT